MSEIERVGVVGCGLMGSGIAEVCARAGLDVVVREVNETALAAGRKRIEGSLGKAVRSGKLPEADREAALSRVRYTTDFGEFGDRSRCSGGSTRRSSQRTPSWPPTRRRSRS